MRQDLKTARLAAGLSQAELGALIGRDQSAISRYESGAYDVEKDIAPALAQALGIDVLSVLYPPSEQAA